MVSAAGSPPAVECGENGQPFSPSCFNLICTETDCVMEDMIRRIVDMDKKAREITEAAEKEKAESEKEIIEKAARLREDYLAQARRRIRVNRETERKAAEEEWAKARAHYDEQLDRINALYAEHGDEWVRRIADAVTGGSAAPAE